MYILKSYLYTLGQLTSQVADIRSSAMFVLHWNLTRVERVQTVPGTAGKVACVIIPKTYCSMVATKM